MGYAARHTGAVMERTSAAIPLAASVDARAVPTSLGAVSWGAVLAGAAGAASLSLILGFLGFGLGMASISPWSHEGVSAQTLGIGSIAWITLTQIAAAALGGYLAGRLRTRWRTTSSDEVYFRDTAHGFLAWSVATLVTAAFLASAVAAIVSGGAKIGAAALGGAAGGATTMLSNADPRNGELDYFVDRLFRGMTATPPTDPAATAPSPATTAMAPDRSDEASRIFSRNSETLAADDIRYLAQLVGERTGLSSAEAETRVRAIYGEWQAATAAAKQKADEARKASAYAALWLFIALLGGAFFASLAAIWGGRARDLTD